MGMNFTKYRPLSFFTMSLCLAFMMCTKTAASQDIPLTKKREFAVNVTPKSTTLNNPLRYYVRWYTSEKNAVRLQVMPIASWSPKSGAFPNLTGLATSFAIERGKRLEKVRLYHALQVEYSVSTLRAANVIGIGSSSNGIVPKSRTYIHDVGLRGIIGCQYHFIDNLFVGIESSIGVGL